MARTAQNNSHKPIEQYVNAVELQGGLYSNYPVVINNTVTATEFKVGTTSITPDKYSPTLTPASVAADTTAEQTFTVTGLATTNSVVVNGPAPTAGTGIVNARVSAANTLALTFVNATAAAVVPTSGTYNILAF